MRSASRVRGVIGRALGALAVLLAAATALATTMRPKAVDCPVCTKGLTVQVIGSWTGDGADGDLCPRVRGGAVLPYSVWTCPHCRWSAWSDEFPQGPGAEAKERILKGLDSPVPIAADSDQRDIPAWVKYELAERIQEWGGAPASKRGWTLLRGAWAVRQECDRDLDALGRASDLSEKFGAACERVWKASLLVEPSADERLLHSLVRRESAAAAAVREADAAREAGATDAVAELVAAYLLRRLGENSAATPYLDRIASAKETAVSLRAAGAAIAGSAARERALQERAVALLLEDARRAEGTSEEKAALRVSVADTLRRLGRPQEAVPLLLAAAGDEDVPAWGLALARHGLAKCGGHGEAAAVFAAAEVRAREGLRRRLRDPETARDAARTIGDLGDPSLVDDVIAALAHEEKEVRDAAMVALNRMDTAGLPPPAVEALEGLVRKGSPLPLCESAFSLVAKEASPSSLPLFREGLSWASRELRISAARGLGRIGTAEDFVAILRSVEPTEEWTPNEVEARALLRALSAFANRELLDPAQARAWWEGAKGRSREAWALEGFRAAGGTMEALGGRDAIPELIRLLGHEEPWIRFNALRVLKGLTGRRFGWDRSPDVWNPPAQRRPEQGVPGWVEEWRAWWAANAEAKPSGGGR